MILTVADVKNRIQMWAIRNIPEERLTDFTDDELIDTINQVAREYNAAALFTWNGIEAKPRPQRLITNFKALSLKYCGSITKMLPG